MRKFTFATMFAACVAMTPALVHAQGIYNPVPRGAQRVLNGTVVQRPVPVRTGSLRQMSVIDGRAPIVNERTAIVNGQRCLEELDRYGNVVYDCPTTNNRTAELRREERLSAEQLRAEQLRAEQLRTERLREDAHVAAERQAQWDRAQASHDVYRHDNARFDRR